MYRLRHTWGSEAAHMVFKQLDPVGSKNRFDAESILKNEGNISYPPMLPWLLQGVLEKV